MISHAALFGLILVAMDGPRAAAPETAADRVTLRDGSVVLGLVNSTPAGPPGSVEFLVRRRWAEKSLERRLQHWDRALAAQTRLASIQRRKRLEAWSRDRAPVVGPDDRIMGWINRELARLAAPAQPDPSILLSVRLPRNEIRAILHRPASAENLLRLAWLCDLPDPESMPLAELKDALEARGYAVNDAGSKEPAALDRLLPPAPEAEPLWLARRAATELAIDPDLRFIRFQDSVFPDSGAGMPLAGAGLATALSELKRLLDPDQGQPADPLAEKLKAIAARGRIAAVVTRLEIAPDFSSVTVDAALLVRTMDRWAPAGSRTATVRPDELGRDAGKNLEADPQVSGLFGIAESLGLGAIPAEIKQRSLNFGAATERALGMARAAFNHDLSTLALPVFEPMNDDRAQNRDQDRRLPR